MPNRDDGGAAGGIEIPAASAAYIAAFAANGLRIRLRKFRGKPLYQSLAAE